MHILDIIFYTGTPIVRLTKVIFSTVCAKLTAIYLYNVYIEVHDKLSYLKEKVQCLRTAIFFCLSVCLSECLCICQSVGLPLCLSVCLSVSAVSAGTLNVCALVLPAFILPLKCVCLCVYVCFCDCVIAYKTGPTYVTHSDNDSTWLCQVFCQMNSPIKEEISSMKALFPFFLAEDRFLLK